jgi:hypothetical protein
VDALGVPQPHNGSANNGIGSYALFEQGMGTQTEEGLLETATLLASWEQTGSEVDIEQDDAHAGDVDNADAFLVAPPDMFDTLSDSDFDDDIVDDELLSAASDDHAGDLHDSDAHLRVPVIALWRLNLTALSQHYNLYFAAYRDKIHISRPRSCVSHVLPQTPDLMLSPGPSIAARSVRGTLDRISPHQVNHLTIGDFGEEEILLMAYDDGDVVGYYTRNIEDDISGHERARRNRPSCSSIQPFFHENVQISAWGLAIHSKSRMIAVGSNLHSITVFIPALTEQDGPPIFQNADRFYHSVCKTVSGYAQDFHVREEGSAPVDIRWLRRRDLNWKITFDTRPQGDNIPNLTFSNDKEGNANQVVAIDIKGNIWLMDIWNLDAPFQIIPSLHRSLPNAFPGDYGRYVLTPSTAGPV